MEKHVIKPHQAVLILSLNSVVETLVYVMCNGQAGQTALSIAERLGYISVTEILRSVTDETLGAPATSSTDKYTIVVPETMHETSLSDSEDEGLLKVTIIITIIIITIRIMIIILRIYQHADRVCKLMLIMLLSRSSRQRDCGFTHRSCPSVCPSVSLLVCLSVCHQNAKKRDFLKN